MRLFNKKTDKIPPVFFYIGRGSSLGNPDPIGKSGTREEVIELYRRYINKEIDSKNPVILAKLLQLKSDSNLVCYCVPAPCHGHVIEDVWKKRIKDYCSPRSLFYAGISSSITPEITGDLMKRCATRLNDLGFVLRGSVDSFFERGASQKEIYLPWSGYHDHDSPISAPSAEAYRLAEQFHPKWQTFKQDVKALMALNCHQILGQNLRTPSDFVVCWTADGAETSAQRTYKTGDMGMAIDLADCFKIPVFNLKNQDALLRLKEHLKINPLLDSHPNEEEQLSQRM